MVFCGVVFDCIFTCGNIYGFKPRISCDKPRCFVFTRRADGCGHTYFVCVLQQ